MNPDKRTPRFVEKFTRTILILAAAAGMIVLTDFSMVIPMWDGAFIKFGGASFSADMKGAVIGVLVIGGLTAALKFWFPGSETPPPPSSPEQPKETI